MSSRDPHTRGRHARRPGPSGGRTGLRLALASVAAAVLALSGCGDGTDGADADGQGDVSTTNADGDISIETEDGSFEVSTEDELPEGFPESIPLPEEYEVTLSSGSGDEVDLYLNVDGVAVDVFGDLSAAFVDAGWNEVSSQTTPVGETTMSVGSYENDDLAVGLTVVTNPDSGGADVQYSIDPR